MTFDLALLRAHLLHALGLTLAACGPGNPGGDTGSAGDTSSDPATGDPLTTTSAGPTSGATSGGGTTSGDDSTTHVPHTTTHGSDTIVTTGGDTTDPSSTSHAHTTTGEPSSTSHAHTTTGDDTTGGDTDGFVCPPPPPEFTQQYACFPLPDGLFDCAACDDACEEENLNAVLPHDFCSWDDLVVECGPDPTVAADQCCYFFHKINEICEGRPFLVAGEPRTAPVVPRADWHTRDILRDLAPTLALTADLAASDPLRRASLEPDPRTRAALAAAWSDDAAAEHASVAAFARFILQLLAVGAPADLVAAAQRALADEVEHARACFALASRHAGRALGPGPLDMSDTTCPTDLPEILAATILEGCIGETLAAALAAAAAAQTRDPAAHAALTRIARDEADHAALAWRFIRWSLEQHPELAPHARRVLADALARPPAARPWPADVDPTIMQAHGRLAPDVQAALIHEALREVLAPCAAALIAPVAHAA